MAKRQRFRWQEEHVAFFCEIVPGHSQGEVADMFEDRFGVRLSVSQVKNAKMRYHVRSGTSGGQFKPGQKAWNKGVPASEWMSPEAMERCKASRFQRGNIPLNAKAFKVGDERVNADGYTEVKIAELTSKEVKKVWKPKHLIVWEREHGCKVPVDADGVPICIGDEVNVNDNAMTVLGYRLYDGEINLAVENKETSIGYAILPSCAHHCFPEPPDSWEKLEEDSLKGPCTYFGKLEDQSVSCPTCPHGHNTTGRNCGKNMNLDLVKRAKKLAGIEEQEGGERTAIADGGER